MPKAGELTYYERIGEASRQAALLKPFSLGQHTPPFTCGDHLIALGGVCELLRPTPSRLLDLGCGTGWTSLLFAKMGYDVVGQDVAVDAITLADAYRLQSGIDNASFLVSDYESLHFQQAFENVVFFDSLHHAVDERAALACAYQALKPGGVCVTREPGSGHAKAEHSLHAVAEYDVTEKDMPPFHIAEIALELGFSEVRIYPFPNQLFRSLRKVRQSHFHRPWRNPLGLAQRWLAALHAGFRTTHLWQRMYHRGGLVQLIK